MTKIKICGIKDQPVIPTLNQYLPDYVGFVFAKSPRQIKLPQAAALRRQLKPEIKTVAVVTAYDLSLITALVKQQVIQAVQLHCSINAQQLKQLQQLGLQVFQVVKPTWPRLAAADYWMYDAVQPGSGKLADWQQIDHQQHPLILAGGLNPANVAQAIKQVQPQIVDVSSGVETNGNKDRNKIIDFIRSVRNADQKKYCN
ncbi:MAG: phosphoribosylanthranilate isomerase [Liquorilactobacillus ghanensis]|uniref:phosphoribosylanthranilate isomerase n=1 Tax=Liquorilactobacillus ghanensis TaxID=399370 RepID=UPI0039ED90D9